MATSGTTETPAAAAKRKSRSASRQALRVLLTILMYAGVVVFVFPYITGHLTNLVPFMIGGAGTTIVCGLLRCYLTEGDCSPIPNSGRDW